MEGAEEEEDSSGNSPDIPEVDLKVQKSSISYYLLWSPNSWSFNGFSRETQRLQQPKTLTGRCINRHESTASTAETCKNLNLSFKDQNMTQEIKTEM